MKLESFDSTTRDWIKSHLQFQHLQIAFSAMTQVNSETRQQLRRACLDQWKLTKMVSTAESEFLDLKKLPRLLMGDLSLSHSPPWGWCAVSFDAAFLGIDAEPTNRISQTAVQRISVAEEMTSCPASPTHLWVAKEAAFKAFSKSNGIRLISDIQIDQWDRLAPDQWQVQAQSRSLSDVSIRGLVLPINDCIFSIFKSHLNFPPGTPIKL